MSTLKISLDLRFQRPPNKGLTIELSPRSVHPEMESVWISEDAFGFLEPSVKRYCLQYTKMSHWGVTVIKPEEWLLITDDWNRIRVQLDDANVAAEYAEEVWFFSEKAKLDFQENFKAVRSGLMELILQLEKWIQAVLERHQYILMKSI